MPELGVHQSALLTDLALCVKRWRLLSPGWYVFHEVCRNILTSCSFTTRTLGHESVAHHKLDSADNGGGAKVLRPTCAQPRPGDYSVSAKKQIASWRRC